MSTNYYLVPPKASRLAFYLAPKIHVCKFSAGWRAIFEAQGIRGPSAMVANPSLSVSTFSEIKALVDRALAEVWTLEDEYGQEVAPQTLWEKVEARQDECGHNDDTYHFISADGYDFCYQEFS